VNAITPLDHILIEELTGMSKERITRRQKDISRLMREKKKRQRETIRKKTKKSWEVDEKGHFFRHVGITLILLPFSREQAYKIHVAVHACF
jgi:hypothetical protein